MAAKRVGNSRSLDDLSKKIIQVLKERFVEAGHGASALANGYVGVPINQLTERIRENANISEVDFDLSLKHLEEGDFVKTGPMAMYDNRPGSGIFILGMYSKREYACLTEAGYRVPTESVPPSRNRPTQIHISGGNFHQSQIALGEQVTQQQRIENMSDAEVITSLVQLLSKSGAPIDQAAKDDVTRLVATAQEGHLKEAKPIFQKLFGLATETVKQEAWAILTALITQAMGL